MTPLSPDRVLYNPANGKVASLECIFGLDPGETRVSPEIRALAPEFDSGRWAHPPLYLPPVIRAQLDLETGGEVRMTGRSFTYAGEFDQSVLQNMLTIDGLKRSRPRILSLRSSTWGAR